MEILLNISYFSFSNPDEKPSFLKVMSPSNESNAFVDEAQVRTTGVASQKAPPTKMKLVLADLERLGLRIELVKRTSVSSSEPSVVLRSIQACSRKGNMIAARLMA